MHINLDVTDTIKQSIEAEMKKVESAAMKALNKTARWLRSETIKRVSEEKKMPKRVFKNKFIIHKATRKLLESKVRLKSSLIGVAKLGSIEQTVIGARVGKCIYKGAFIAVMRNGHVGIFRRRGMKSTPIDEEKVDSHADEVLKGLAENEGGEVFEKYFYQEMDVLGKFT